MRIRTVLCLVFCCLPAWPAGCAAAETVASEDYFLSFADLNTVTLWLFDEPPYPYTTLTDASACEYDLRLMEGGTMVPGKFGGALETRSGRAVSYAGFVGKVPEEELRKRDGKPSGLWGPTETPSRLIEALAGKSWTVEMWLNPSSTVGDQMIIDLGQACGPGFSLSLADGKFLIENYFGGVRAICPTTLTTDRWRHVAFAYSGGAIHHFVDGKEQEAGSLELLPKQVPPDPQQPKDREHESRGFDKMDAETRRQNRFNIALGADRRSAKPMRGMVDELRVSNVRRYTGAFAPASFSRNHGPAAPKASGADGPPPLFGSGTSGGPLKLGGRKHVFIDDGLLKHKSGVTVVMNKPYGKEQLVLDFEIRKSAWRPSVYDVDGTVYMAIPDGYGSEDGLTRLATSKDGLSFSVHHEALIRNTPLYGAFFRDLNPNVRPEERYKACAFVANRGMYLYVSPDGRHWRRNETIQLPLRSGGGGECFWDDQRGRYAAYLKRDRSFANDECPRAGGRTAVGFWTDEVLKPWPFRKMQKPYFEGYPFPAVTGEGPVSIGVSPAGEVYRTRAIKYPWAPDVYLAFIWRYPSDDGPRHVELTVSRDGERWTFFGKDWYIPIGTAEEELSIYGLLRRGDEIWQYVDEGGAHGGSDPRTYYRYRQRLDGFTSLDAADAGKATTRPLLFTGTRLVLNVASRGSVRVGIVNEDGSAIPGFALADCKPIRTESVRAQVNWRGGPNVGLLAGKAVRLVLEMNDAKLYSLQFIE